MIFLMFILKAKRFSDISQGQQVFELWEKENGDENLLHDSSRHSVPNFFAYERFYPFSKKA